MLRYVCDRCKKEIPMHNCRTAFLKVQTEMVGAGIRVKGNYLLCDECANNFADRFIDGYQRDSDEVKEECEDTSTKKQPAVYWDLGNGKLLKIPASIVQASSVMNYDDTDNHSSWVCPQCRSKYVFWIGSGQDPIRVCYADEVFTTRVNIPRSYFRSGKDVAFECPTCKRLLYVPDLIIKEVK